MIKLSLDYLVITRACLFALIMFASSVCFSKDAGSDVDVEKLWRSFDVKALGDYSVTKLKPGMSKTQVKEILGNPDNSAPAYVWMWPENRKNRGKPWKEMYYTGGGLFLLFYNDKLLADTRRTTMTLLPTGKIDPWAWFSFYARVTMKETESLIGDRTQPRNTYDFEGFFDLPDMIGTNAETKPFIAPGPKVDLSKDSWTLTMGIGSGQFGFNTVQVASDGKVNLLLQLQIGSAEWTNYRYRVDRINIRTLSREVHFNGLVRSYQSNISDGTQAYLSYSSGDHIYTVWMDNYFPEAFIKIRNSIIANILEDKVQKLGLSKAPIDSSAQLLIHRAAFKDYLKTYNERH